jgi:hypothetical protein
VTVTYVETPEQVHPKGSCYTLDKDHENTRQRQSHSKLETLKNIPQLVLLSK